ncbi:hypothetical protein IOCL1545_000026900 [Leishmania shawi]|uniref:Uncharacterized protein n=1 Tax=Leishmania shawi TaxID=5680 RepID=A0ABR3EGJ6_9TRYP
MAFNSRQSTPSFLLYDTAMDTQTMHTVTAPTQFSARQTQRKKRQQKIIMTPRTNAAQYTKTEITENPSATRKRFRRDSQARQYMSVGMSFTVLEQSSLRPHIVRHSLGVLPLRFLLRNMSMGVATNTQKNATNCTAT